MKKYLKEGFYFSYNYKLHKKYKYQEGKVNFRTNVFNWNYKTVKTMIGVIDSYEFFTPIIQGYVGFFETPKGKVFLISRRSYILGGTRYNCRGIDNNGHVSNYVETE